jgi:hypothetical protein
VVDDDHALTDSDALACDGRMGVERLRTAAYGDHHLADGARGDCARDTAGLADDPVISHGTSIYRPLRVRKSRH